MKIIKAKSPGIVWKKLIKETLSNGLEIYDDQTKLTEITNVLIQINEPCSTDSILKKNVDIEMLNWMKKNFLSQDPVENWGYSYGQRISNYLGENQIETITKKLKKSLDSKSATITLSLPPEDKKHSPCVNIIDFKYRNNQLNATGFMRSQDVGKKAYADYICLGIILDNLANDINVKVGELIIHVASLHIYEGDLNDLKTKFPDLF